MTSVAKLFLELSSNDHLHQKLLSSCYFQEEKLDGISLLFKTLYVFMKDLQQECAETKRTLSSSSKRLASLGSELCQECSEKFLHIYYQETEKENILKPNTHGVLTNINLNQKFDLESSVPCSEFPKKSGSKTSSNVSPQKSVKDKVHSVPSDDVIKLVPCQDLKHGADPFSCSDILAQETQEFNEILAARVPINGRTCIPETVPMDLLDSVEASAANESSDVFDDSSEDGIDSSEVCTVLHTSPVLGKLSSNINSPKLVYSLSSSSSSRSTCTKNSKKAHSIESLSHSQQVNDVKELKGEPVESSKKWLFCESSSSAMSPKCGSEIESSPSLLQLKPLKKVQVTDTMSHSDKPPSLVDIYSLSASPQLAESFASECSDNLNSVAATSPDQSSSIAVNTELSSCKNSKASSVGNNVKQNLASKFFKDDTKALKPSKRNISSCTDVHSSLSNNECSSETPAAPQKETAAHNIAVLTSGSFAEMHRKRSLIKKTTGVLNKKSLFKISQENASPEDSRHANNKLLNLTIQDCSLPSKPSASRLSLSKRSATDDSSSSIAFRGSLLKWDLMPKSVPAAVKKNVKQTKLTKESFVVSKRKGNVEEDNPLLAEAKARSLATKAMDDRKRLQLLHPVLRQSSSSIEQESSVIHDNYSPSHHRSRGSTSEEYDQKKFKTEFVPAASNTNTSYLPHDVSSSSLVTESQVLKYLIDSPSGLDRVDIPVADEVVKSPSKHSSSPKKEASEYSPPSKSTTPHKLSGDESSAKKFSFRRRSNSSCSPSKKVRSPRKTVTRKSPAKKSKESPKKCISFEANLPAKKRKAKMADEGAKRTKIMDDSFDRVPCVDNSPAFAHAGPVERNRARRLELPGWSCRLCQQYYEGRQLSREQLLEYMNRCSKHRSKYKPITNTPEGFWKPDMSVSEDDDE
ncbi:hypothetical protein FHG87_004789 [Trinorchestia longiramus]|nr:hypothetical protein FHG87_004789 [Trinorchestia longiramus]